MNSFAINFEEYNQRLIDNNELNLNYLTYVSKYNEFYSNYRFDLKALDKISTFIESDKWLPAYFFYEFEVLNSKYNHKDIRILLLGENKSKTPNYIEHKDYIELTDKNEIEKYDIYNSTGVRGNAPPNSENPKHAGGPKQSKLFIIEPYAFICILQGSRNRYSRYLAFIVKYHIVYVKYQKLVSEYKSNITIVEKEDEISKLRKTIELFTQSTNAKIDSLGNKLDGIQTDLTILSENNIVYPPSSESEKYELLIYEAIDNQGHTQYDRILGICTCSDSIGYIAKNKSGKTIGPFHFVVRAIMNGNINTAITSINFRIGTPFIHYKDVANPKRLVKYILDKIPSINSWYSYFNITYNTEFTRSDFVGQLDHIYKQRLYIKDTPYTMVKEIKTRKTKK
jgi:hypothetical protein